MLSARRSGRVSVASLWVPTHLATWEVKSEVAVAASPSCTAQIRTYLSCDPLASRTFLPATHHPVVLKPEFGSRTKGTHHKRQSIADTIDYNT